MKLLTQAGYQLNLRAAVRGLWSGQIDFDAAFGMLLQAIDRGFTQAWTEGAKECGIEPGEWTAEERTALAVRIGEEKTYIYTLLEAVEAGRKGVGKLAPLYTRLQMWVNRYQDVKNQAKTMACADQKLKWVLGPTEHCETCMKAAGKVKRASQWAKTDLRPQAPCLQCGGYRCQCSLVLTDEPLSRGRLPACR